MTEPYLTIAKNTTYEQIIKNHDLFAPLPVSPQMKKLNSLLPVFKQLIKKLLTIVLHT